MRERIENKHVTKEIKGQMPVIPADMLKERGCTFCPYYLGSYEKQPRCVCYETVFQRTGRIVSGERRRADMPAVLSGICGNAGNQYQFSRSAVQTEGGNCQ